MDPGMARISETWYDETLSMVNPHRERNKKRGITACTTLIWNLASQRRPRQQEKRSRTAGQTDARSYLKSPSSLPSEETKRNGEIRSIIMCAFLQRQRPLIALDLHTLADFYEAWWMQITKKSEAS